MAYSIDILIGLAIAFLIYAWRKKFLLVAIFIELILFAFIVMVNTIK